MDKPDEESRLLAFRQQAWFHPYVVPDSLPPFPVDEIGLIGRGRPNTWQVRSLIGKGPAEFELTVECEPYFGHGEEPYPIFVCPSIGPKGAGLSMRTNKRAIKINGSETLFMLEVVLLRAGPQDWVERFEKDMVPSGIDLEPPKGGMFQDSLRYLSQARDYLDLLVGFYSSYQYPLVWERIGRTQAIFCVDIARLTVQCKSPLDFDNFIPFRLDVRARLEGNSLKDDLTPNISRVLSLDLRIPLLFLQNSLWTRDIHQRFLQEFWIAEHLAHRHILNRPPEPELESFVRELGQFVRGRFPDRSGCLDRIRSALLNPSISEVISRYCAAVGVSVCPVEMLRLGAKSPEDFWHMATRTRNKLSHGARVDKEKVRILELGIRQPVREMIRREMENSGITFGETPVPKGPPGTQGGSP